MTFRKTLMNHRQTESNTHVVAETINWLDKFVKNAERTSTASAR